MRSIALSIVVLALAGIAPASAQFVVDHQPYPYGGPGADTALSSASLPFTWQLVADDFRVFAPGLVKHVNWWGFHKENVAPPNETMRIRLYREPPGDGLPGEILYEETFVNPERIETGRTIAIGGSPREYKYHVELAKPLEFSPGLVYWLEIAQIGDPNSGFRWEFSRADTNGFASKNNLFPDWRRTTLTSDLAFQLIVPEPVTAALLFIGFVFAAGLRARGRFDTG
jgi:hypothetical protein